jgi:hypothetical protein
MKHKGQRTPASPLAPPCSLFLSCFGSILGKIDGRRHTHNDNTVAIAQINCLLVGAFLNRMNLFRNIQMQNFSKKNYFLKVVQL